MYCFGFRFGGLDKITWCHRPKYESSVMMDPAIVFLTGNLIVHNLELCLDDLPAFISQVEDLRVVVANDGPSKEDQQRYSSWGKRGSWQRLLYKSQRGLDCLKVGVLLDRRYLLYEPINFQHSRATSCFLINLDEMSFEVYISRYLRMYDGILVEGSIPLPFQEDTGGRQLAQGRYPNSPMGLVATFDLSQIRSWHWAWHGLAQTALPQEFHVPPPYAPHLRTRQGLWTMYEAGPLDDGSDEP